MRAARKARPSASMRSTDLTRATKTPVAYGYEWPTRPHKRHDSELRARTTPRKFTRRTRVSITLQQPVYVDSGIRY